MESRKSARSRVLYLCLFIFVTTISTFIAVPVSAGFTLTIYEQTGSINAYTFDQDDICLYDEIAGMPGPLVQGYAGYDFSTGGCEFYDIYFCDTAGAVLDLKPGEPLPLDIYLKLECWDISCNTGEPVGSPGWPGAGNNIDAVVLDLDGQVLYGRAVVAEVYGLCQEPFELKESNFASSALGPPDADITKMGGGYTVITLYMGSMVPEPPDTMVEHDPLIVNRHPYFEWIENGIGWHAENDGYITGIVPYWDDALISSRSFDPAGDPFVIFRFRHEPDAANFMGGYTSILPPANNFHYSNINLGIYIHSTGSIRPTWDVHNTSYWSTTLTSGYYDVKIAVGDSPGTVSFAIDRVANWSSPPADFSSPEWSVVERREIAGPYHIQINPYNESSRIYDVWSSNEGEIPPPPPPPQSPEPLILSIEDIGNDEGRQVRLKWQASPYDSASSREPVTGYALWRRIDELPAWMSVVYNVIPGPVPMYPPGDWDYVGIVPACCEETYATVVPTLADAVEGDIHWSVFFVRALTGTPEIYFDSPPDSGYSVCDILPPDPGEDPEEVRTTDYLGRNYPNPFNPVTEIRFGLRDRGHVLIRIFDAGGRLVRTLVKGEMSSGDHAETWNGTDDYGRMAASGVYFCRLDTKGLSKSMKMVLLR